jgi:cyclopropane fatty-acyl-phospholipid synthase-like methyltransferase
MSKPFSQACENNKAPILAVLRDAFEQAGKVLEIGSGTGQHAVHFAEGLPHLHWQTSDVPVHHEGINAWVNEANLPNLAAPIPLHIGQDSFPENGFDAVYSANTAHIMFAHEVQQMMAGIAKLLPAGGVFCQYGPFIYKNAFSSASNEAFHYSLLERGLGGYKSIEELLSWVGNSMQLTDKIDMPANNLCLIWRKQG